MFTCHFAQHILCGVLSVEIFKIVCCFRKTDKNGKEATVGFPRD